MRAAPSFTRPGRDVPRRSAAAVLVAIAAFQFAATLVVVPPWQNPDEPQHVMFAAVMAKRGPAMLPDAYDDAIEGDILSSMARHRWWEFYGWRTPSPIPRTFEGVENVDVSSIQGPALYYVSSGALLKALSVESATASLYVLRTISALAGLTTLWCIGVGTRLLFGTAAGLAVAAVVALHPQFAIVSTTASADAWVNLAAAIVWWQVGRLWTRRGDLLSLLALWAAALLAAATARLGTPLVVVAAGLSLWVIAGRARNVRPVFAVLAVVALVVLGAIIAGNPAVAAGARRIIAYSEVPIRMAFGVTQAPDVNVSGWIDTFWGSFWLTAGWLRYRPPDAVLAAIAMITATAAAGVLVSWVRQPAIRGPVAVAAIFIAVQLAAVIVTFYFNSVGAQGRYMFPALAPILSLIWVGLRQLFRVVPERSVVAAVVVAAYVFNVVAWTTVLLPTYG